MANNKIQVAAQKQQMQAQQGQPQQMRAASLNDTMAAILDREGMRKRFDELLGKRAPQFISSIISLVNSTPGLQNAMREAPMTIIQAGLRAAMYDLPIDPGLGYAYIVPFKNKKKLPSGETVYVNEAAFILGYKGMEQLALRSGVYSRVPTAVDVREGELVSYDRLTGDAVFNWIEDEDERDSKPIVGYAAYFRLLNGAEKTIYKTRKQIEKHEQRNRKGQYMGQGWARDFDAMARKTVLRDLLSHYGVMSIDYQSKPLPGAVDAAQRVADGSWPSDQGFAPDDELVVLDAMADEAGEADAVKE